MSNMPNTNTSSTEGLLSPKDLADQLFDRVLKQLNGDHREAARQVINFLRESLVYAVSAAAGDPAAKIALFKSIAESLVAQPSPG